MDNWKAVVCNLDRLQRGYAKLKQSIWPNQVLFSQRNTPTVSQAPDTSAPMDIHQNKRRSETCSCYNCNEKGHILRHCLKPWKQQIQLTESTELDPTWWPRLWWQQWTLEILGKRLKNPRRVFGQIDGETHSLSDQQVFGLRNKYSRVYQRYVDSTITCYHRAEN